MDSRVKPVNVSPIIKGARWSLLFCGIFFGSNRRSHYQCKEYRQRPLREKRVREYNEKLKNASRKSFKAFVHELAGIIGVDLPPNFDPE